MAVVGEMVARSLAALSLTTGAAAKGARVALLLLLLLADAAGRGLGARACIEEPADLFLLAKLSNLQASKNICKRC